MQDTSIDLKTLYAISLEESDKFVQGICRSLDSKMSDISRLLMSDVITDDQLQDCILNLASILYFTSSQVERAGIQQDMYTAIRKKTYNEARLQASGTVAEKDSMAMLATCTDSVVEDIYARAYKQMKAKLDSGYEMLNSLKKVMTTRIAELELSNSRYINTRKEDNRWD